MIARAPLESLLDLVYEFQGRAFRPNVEDRRIRGRPKGVDVRRPSVSAMLWVLRPSK